MIIHRIKEFIDFKTLKVRQLEKAIGASDGTIRNAIKNETEINSKWLVLLSDTYPELNVNWLVTGKGKMLKKDTCKDISDYSADELFAVFYKNKDKLKESMAYNLYIENEIKDGVIETLEKEKEKLINKSKIK